MNTGHAFRRITAFVFVIALFAVSATSAFAIPNDPCTSCPDEPTFIIVIGG